MPLLKPEINSVLESVGLVPKQEPVSELKQTLDSRGLSLDSLTRNLKSIIEYADKEETKLRATELAFKLHKVLNGDNKSPDVPQITFLIKGDNINLTEILTPRS